MSRTIKHIITIEMPDDPTEVLDVKYVFLSGKITGEPNAEEYFRRVEDHVYPYCRDLYNPYEHCKKLGIDNWFRCMKESIGVLRTSDVVVAMDNYMDSEGATLELQLATIYNIPIYIVGKDVYGGSGE